MQRGAVFHDMDLFSVNTHTHTLRSEKIQNTCFGFNSGSQLSSQPITSLKILILKAQSSQSYLAHFAVFTHVGFVRTGEFRGELVDVQHVDGYGHPTGQDWTVCRRESSREGSINQLVLFLPLLTPCGHLEYCCFRPIKAEW